MSYVITGVNLISSGSGYDATPTINLHGKKGGGTGAFIRAQMTNYSVSGISVVNGGSGYTTLPTVIFSGYGGGTGAAAIAQFGYSITGISLTSSGSGYSGNPAVLFSGGGGINNGIRGPILGVSTARASGLTGTDYLAMDFTGVTGFVMVSGGTGFSSVPAVVVSGGFNTGSGYAASGIALTGDPVITGFRVISGGSGYSTGFYPLVSGGDVSAGGYSGTGYVSIDHGLRGSGFVTGFEIVSGGSEFTGQFHLVVSGGFTFATPSESVYGCQACLFYPATGLVSNVNGLGSGFITGFKLASGISLNYPSGGSGYTSTPSFSMSGGSGGVSDFLSGSGELVMPTGFSGDIVMSHGMGTTALVGSYSKEFTGQWNLLTGSGGTFYDYRSNGRISGAAQPNAGYTGSTYYFKSNGSNIGVEESLNIRVTNLNYWDNLVSVARLTVSGSGNLIEHDIISGVR